jgi:methylmalonyl-CoA/ethylmalonyl-CoA epimerase
MALSFHHIGVACHDLQGEIKRLTALGYLQERASFVDKTQGVEGIFMNGGGPRLELLRPLHENSVLCPWLKAGKKFYHLAYTVGGELKQELSKLRAQGAKLVVAPVSAAAFEGAEICFLMMPNILLVELIAVKPEY